MNCRTDVIYEVFPTKEKPWPCKQTNAHTTKVRIAPANLEIPGHITQCSNCSLDCKKCVISGVRAQSLHAIVSPIFPSLLITWKKKAFVGPVFLYRFMICTSSSSCLTSICDALYGSYVKRSCGPKSEVSFSPHPQFTR